MATFSVAFFDPLIRFYELFWNSVGSHCTFIYLYNFETSFPFHPGYIKYATKFVTPRRKHRLFHKMYVYIKNVRLSACIYANQFLFSLRNCPFVGTADIGPLQHIAVMLEWKTLSFNEISSRNLAGIIVYDKGAISAEIFRIGSLKHITAI